MNNRYKVLIVEDETNICRFVTALLETSGYQVMVAHTAEAGLMLFASHVPDLIILDLGLPDADGMVFLHSVRRESLTPVIVLSARTQEHDKVEALDAGANDYVTKPFGSAELLARIRSVLRNNRHANEEGKYPGGRFECGELVIDYDARRVCMEGAEIKFTQTEFNILALLSEHFGKVLTYTFIIREIWGSADSGSTKKLQVNMANIRKKLSLKPGENRYISNELGVGYRMHADME